METKPDSTPLSLKRVLCYGLLIAAASSLVSLAMLYLQAERSEDHIAGVVTAVNADTILITNVHGMETVITITPETRIEDLDSLATGTPIMSIGRFTEPGHFTAEGIRRFEKRR